MMRRYNQGFYKFGAMEQCDTGEWIKASDLERIKLSYVEQHAKVFSSLVAEMYQENISIMLKLKVITALLVMSIVANGVLLGS